MTWWRFEQGKRAGEEEGMRGYLKMLTRVRNGKR
jgi:hypothetical protein